MYNENEFTYLYDDVFIDMFLHNTKVVMVSSIGWFRLLPHPSLLGK